MIKKSAIIASILCISGSMVFGSQQYETRFTREQQVPCIPINTYLARRTAEFTRVALINEQEYQMLQRRGSLLKLYADMCLKKMNLPDNVSTAYASVRYCSERIKEKDMRDFRRNREDESDND